MCLDATSNVTGNDKGCSPNPDPKSLTVALTLPFTLNLIINEVLSISIDSHCRHRRPVRTATIYPVVWECLQCAISALGYVPVSGMLSKNLSQCLGFSEDLDYRLGWG